MKISSYLVFIIAAIFTYAQADIVDLGKFYLPSMKVIKKFQFFFSGEDRDARQNDGAIRFDLAL